MRTALINTPLQRGGWSLGLARNRFNGFGRARETVETVSPLPPVAATPLKRGVNETETPPPHSALRAADSALRTPHSAFRSPDSAFRPPDSAFRTPHSALRVSLAFTLLELLVVIAIIGLLAALSVPVLNNFKPNHAANATRVLMDDLSRARQLAISEHTTVLMVFVKTNFWDRTLNGNFPVGSWRPLDWARTTNLVSKQLIGYTFVSLHSLGDQPGIRTPQYLSGWKTLPEGAFIAFLKFALPTSVTFPIRTNDANGNLVMTPYIPLDSFNYTTQVPFPLLDTPPYSPKQAYIALPYIAFNYLGQRCDDTGLAFQQNAVFPLAKGNISFARDQATHIPKYSSPTVSEIPPGNATNGVSYSLVYVDWLTGRARAIQQEVR
jgi:prepilin-type N-terminal cleavage/methylation domain-containing protein